MRRKYSLRFFHLIHRVIRFAGKALLLQLLLVAGSSLQAQDTPAPTEAPADILADTAIVSQEDYDMSEDDSTVEPGYFTIKTAGTRIDSVQARQLPDSVLKNLKTDEEFWYADKIFKDNKDQYATDEDAGNYKTSEPLSQKPWVQTILWLIIIAGFTAFVILYLSNSNMGLFRKSNKAFDEPDAELETDDIFAINYQKEIDKATAASNYRLAIRLMFLRLLKNLSEKNIIQYKHDRTNFDYLLQLSSTKYYHDFFRITRNYEYSWYGKFEVSPDAYKLIKNDFEKFDPAIQ